MTAVTLAKAFFGPQLECAHKVVPRPGLLPGGGKEMELSEAERSALSPLDRDTLVDLGGHPYLVFMAELRLRIARDPGVLEYF